MWVSFWACNCFSKNHWYQSKQLLFCLFKLTFPLDGRTYFGSTWLFGVKPNSFLGNKVYKLSMSHEFTRSYFLSVKITHSTEKIAPNDSGPAASVGPGEGLGEPLAPCTACRVAWSTLRSTSLPISCDTVARVRSSKTNQKRPKSLKFTTCSKNI